MNYDEILKKISPDSEEITALNNSLETVKSLIEDFAKKHNFSVEVVAGGSTAKGTFLKGSFDVDIFVRFKSKGDLSNMLEKVIMDLSEKLNVAVEKVHGSRDYFQFEYKGFFFEIVPVKFINSLDEMENVTDMSPLHVFWVKKKLNEKLAGDIRLAKQFCKSCDVYGAESFINGISGHVLDILIIEYGSFDNFIKEVSNWSGITIVDPEKKHSNVLKELNQAKLVSPLIVVDPIDLNRNASAALSKKKYNKLIATCRKFLKQPDVSFFEIKPFDLKSLQSKQLDNELLFVVSCVPVEGKKDVVATKILKVFEFIERHLRLYNFSIRFCDWHYSPNQSELFFFVKNEILEKQFEREGPPIKNKSDALRFKKIHGDKVYERDGRLFVKVNREFINPINCISHLIKQKYVLSRTDSTKLNLFIKSKTSP